MTTAPNRFVMKGAMPVAPFQDVTWSVYGAPDFTGASSGYGAGYLINIVLDYTVIDDIIQSPNAVPVYLIPSGPASGDLGGNYPAPIVIALQGNAIEEKTLSSAQDGYILTWNGTEWSAEVNSLSVTLNGDVTGPTGSNTVVKLQGNAVESQSLGSSQDGYVLTWKNSSSQWQAQIPVTTISPFNSQTFTSNGNFTVPTGITQIMLIGCGGGLGGDSGAADTGGTLGGSGGNGSILATQCISVVSGNTYSVTIGAGGSGATGSSYSSGNIGNPGSATSFGSLAYFNGGLVGLIQSYGGGGSGNGNRDVGTGYANLTGNGTGGSPGNTVTGGGNSWSGGGGGGAGPGGNGANGSDGVNSGNSSNGSNASANTGAGGGGSGGCPSGSTSGNGGNGGSGFLQVIW